MQYSFKTIVASLPRTKNSKSSWWVKLWVRKCSFPFTWLFINLGWSSNAVSGFSIFVSLIACICFAMQSMTAQIFAVALINFWLVLDCVDGNIARCKKAKKLYGEFIDAMGGYFTVAFIYLAISLSAYNHGGVFLEEKTSVWIVVLGAISSISDILARLIYTNYRSVIRDEEHAKSELMLQEDNRSINYIRKRISKELGISGLFMPLTIIGLCFHCYDVITLFYLLFNVFALLTTAGIYFLKASQYDKTQNKDICSEKKK